jgi:RNA polymerase sigma-70 factor (ECF subfamily)
MTEDSELSNLHAAHQQFSALLADVRPALHRYCARMTGSVIDGEDLVQDTLAHAYYELSQLRELPALRTWLFRIAHSRAIDFLRRRQRRAGDRAFDDELSAVDGVAAKGGDDSVERAQALGAALAHFLQLPAAQRGCVILKDVLEYSLEEIAEMLELSVPAVKAALHRGRVRLSARERGTSSAPPAVFPPELLRYAALFNARDWDGVRAMLVDDVKLELVAREKREGLAQVGKYFTNYAGLQDWRLVPVWVEGQAFLAVTRPGDSRPRYLVQLTVREGRVHQIRDFRHAGYIVDDASLVSA